MFGGGVGDLLATNGAGSAEAGAGDGDGAGAGVWLELDVGRAGGDILPAGVVGVPGLELKFSPDSLLLFLPPFPFPPL